MRTREQAKKPTGPAWTFPANAPGINQRPRFGGSFEEPRHARRPEQTPGHATHPTPARPQQPHPASRPTSLHLGGEARSSRPSSPSPSRNVRATNPMPAWTAERQRANDLETALAQQLAHEQAEQERAEVAARAAKLAVKQITANRVELVASQEAVPEPQQPARRRWLNFIVNASGALVPHRPRRQQQPAAPEPQPLLPVEAEARRAVDAIAPQVHENDYHPFPIQPGLRAVAEQQPAPVPAVEVKEDTPIFYGLRHFFAQIGRARAHSHATPVKSEPMPLPSHPFLLQEALDSAAEAQAKEDLVSISAAWPRPTANQPATPQEIPAETEAESTGKHRRINQKDTPETIAAESSFPMSVQDSETAFGFEPRTPYAHQAERYEGSDMANVGLFLAGTALGREAGQQERINPQ